MRIAPAERNAIGRPTRARICQYFDMNAKTAEWEALCARLLIDARQNLERLAHTNVRAEAKPLRPICCASQLEREDRLKEDTP